MKPSNVTLAELDLPPIDGPAENYWRLSELRGGIEPVCWPCTQARPDLSDCLAERLPGRPWLLQIWEPLLTKAPSPARCQPYCCYSRTVIFYHRPYIRRGPSPWRRNGRWVWLKERGFVEFDQIDTRLGWDDLIVFDGDQFEIGYGSVRWHHRRWWMHRLARRKATILPATGTAHAAGRSDLVDEGEG